MKEAQVEHHLVKQVKAANGLVRKLKWIGRNSAPDRFVAIPGPHPRRGVWLVELKRPGKGAEDAQAREHVCLHEAGVNVVTLNSIEAVDKFMRGEQPC